MEQGTTEPSACPRYQQKARALAPGGGIRNVTTAVNAKPKAAGFKQDMLMVSELRTGLEGSRTSSSIAHNLQGQDSGGS